MALAGWRRGAETIPGPASVAVDQVGKIAGAAALEPPE